MSAPGSTPGSVALRLYLVRHATHGDLGRRLTGRADGGPLTPEGEREAEAVALCLRGAGLTEVRTSPRLRARLTAGAIARAAAVPLREEPGLDEIDFGAWTGAAFADLEGDAAWDRWNGARATARPPGGEAMAEASGRIAGVVRSLAAQRPGEGIALVTHADMIRGLVATVLGLSLDNIHRFEVAPASVSRIDAEPGRLTLRGLNDTGGLA